MAVRIQVVSYSEQGVKYRINVWDSDYVSATITTLDSNGFEIEYDRLTSFLDPLIASSCYFTLIDDGSYGFTQFISDLANAQEDEFKLYIEKWNGSSYDIFWAGIIMSDMVSWDNDVTPRNFEIVAKDGLNRLEGIYFENVFSSPYSTDYEAKVIKVIFDCLAYAGTAQFWNSSSNPYIAVNMLSHDTLQTAITQADILSYIWVGKEYLTEDPKFNKDMAGIKLKGLNEHPLKAKQILYELLQLFRLRIVLSEGSWRIQEVNQFTYNSIAIGLYDYTGAYAGTTAATLKLTHNGSTLAVQAGGKFGYYPPVRSAKAQIYPSLILNGTYPFTPSINKNFLTTTSSTFALGRIYGGSGSGLQLAIQIDFDIVRWFYKVSADFYLEITAKIEANTYRITNSITYGVEATIPHKGGGAKWSTTSADKYTGNVYYAMNFSMFSTNTIIDRPSSFIVRTEEIPFTAEDATLVVTATLKSVTGSTNWPEPYDLDFKFKQIFVQLIDTAADPPILGQISEIELESPYVTANSIQKDYGLLRIADNLGNTTQAQFNTIMVTAPGVASGLKGSSTWVAGYSSDTDLVTTLLKETIALQKTAIKKYVGPFRSTIYHAWNTISYDSELWAFMGGRYSSKTDTWSGEWFGISHDFAVITDSTTRENEVPGVTNRIKEWRKTFIPQEMYPTSPVPMAKTSSKKASGATVNSFDVDTVAYRHIRNGDNIALINTTTMEKIQEFQVSADVEIGDTSVSVTSETATDNLWQGFFIGHNPREIVASNIIRGVNFQVEKTIEHGIGLGYNQIWHLKVNTPGSTPAVLTTNGLAVSGITNMPLIPDDCAVAGIVYITAKESNEASVASFIRRFLCYNNSGTSALEGAVQTIGTDIKTAVILSAASVDVTVDNTYDNIHIDVTGCVGVDLNWSARLELVIAKNA